MRQRERYVIEPAMGLFSIQLTLLLLVTLLAIRFAGRPEQLVSGTFLSVLVIDQTFHLIVAPLLPKIDVATWHFVLETILSVVVIFIALKADRFWTLFVASAQAIALLVQLLRFAGFDTQNLVGIIMVRTPTWLAIILTGIAILQRLPELKTQQPD